MPRSLPAADGQRRKPALAASDACAPIWRSGSSTRAIGRERERSSPVSTDEKRLAREHARHQPHRRAGVAAVEYVSRLHAGRAGRRLARAAPASRRPRRASHRRPARAARSTVERQSSPGRKLWTALSPSASALNMAARCEIDLSPGTAMVPRSRLAGRTDARHRSLSSSRVSPASYDAILLLHHVPGDRRTKQHVAEAHRLDRARRGHRAWRRARSS